MPSRRPIILQPPDPTKISSSDRSNKPASQPSQPPRRVSKIARNHREAADVHRSGCTPRRHDCSAGLSGRSARSGARADAVRPRSAASTRRRTASAATNGTAAAAAATAAWRCRCARPRSTRADLIEVIRCGRPATGMPYHDRERVQERRVLRWHDQGRPRRRLSAQGSDLPARRGDRGGRRLRHRAAARQRPADTRRLRRVLGRGSAASARRCAEDRWGGPGSGPPHGVAPAQSANTNSIEPGCIFSSPSVLLTNHFGQAPPSPTSSATYCLPSTL